MEFKSDGVYLLDDNGSTYTAVAIKEKCEFKELDHHLYSSDLILKDYNLFSRMKVFIR